MRWGGRCLYLYSVYRFDDKKEASMARNKILGSLTMMNWRRGSLIYRKLWTRSENKVDAKLKIPEAEYDLEFLSNPANRETIDDNIKRRKGVGNINKVLELSKILKNRNELLKEIDKIPNQTAPTVLEYGDEPRLLDECQSKRKFDFTPLPFKKIAKKLNLIRMEDLGPLAGEKSYILLGDLAQMEQALVRYSVEKLLKHGFKLVSVPDILPTKVIEKCGLIATGDRNLVYSLDERYGDDLSLSGTAEMALASMLMDSEISVDKMPLKFAAVSRCYRAEISKLAEERGLYRVHQFTKVEMFACCEQNNSSQLMEQLHAIQREIFSDIGLSFKVLDMPSHELGAAAYRKFDIEGWLPGQQQYGELSSCSNCTDYQSRRLNIKYKSDDDDKLLHAHTLNGTACAIPRMLIAICETYQTKDGQIEIPEKLLPHMNGKTLIGKQPVAPMRDYKYKPKNL